MWRDSFILRTTDVPQIHQDFIPASTLTSSVYDFLIFLKIFDLRSSFFLWVWNPDLVTEEPIHCPRLLNTYAGVPIEEKTVNIFSLPANRGFRKVFCIFRLQVRSPSHLTKILFDTRTQVRNLCGLCVCQKSYLLEIKSVLLLEILGSTKIVSFWDSRYQYKPLWNGRITKTPNRPPEEKSGKIWTIRRERNPHGSRAKK